MKIKNDAEFSKALAGVTIASYESDVSGFGKCVHDARRCHEVGDLRGTYWGLAGMVQHGGRSEFYKALFEYVKAKVETDK